MSGARRGPPRGEGPPGPLYSCLDVGLQGEEGAFRRRTVASSSAERGANGGEHAAHARRAAAARARSGRACPARGGVLFGTRRRTAWPNAASCRRRRCSTEVRPNGGEGLSESASRPIHGPCPGAAPVRQPPCLPFSSSECWQRRSLRRLPASYVWTNRRRRGRATARRKPAPTPRAPRGDPLRSRSPGRQASFRVT